MPGPKKIRIVCLSDTHNHGPGQGYTLPQDGGDLLIHAGDLTNQGTFSEIERAISWLQAASSYQHKVVIAGNHDLALDDNYGLREDGSGWSVLPSRQERERSQKVVKESGLVYLAHERASLMFKHHKDGNGGRNNDAAGESINIKIDIFGSPFTPAYAETHRQNWAFQYHFPPSASRVCPSQDSSSSSSSSSDLSHPWHLFAEMPQWTPSILVTHGPAAGLCDRSAHWPEGGCRYLLSTLRRMRPLLHVCGHCHEGRGAVVVRWGGDVVIDGSGRSSSGSSNNSGRSDQVEKGDIDDEIVYRWEDPGRGNKKISLLDLTGARAGGHRLQVGRETAVVNAAIMATSWGKGGNGKGGKQFNKPIVVDIALPF